MKHEEKKELIKTALITIGNLIIFSLIIFFAMFGGLLFASNLHPNYF